MMMKFNITTYEQKELRSELFSNEFQIEEYQTRNQEILVELYLSQEYIDF